MGHVEHSMGGRGSQGVVSHTRNHMHLDRQPLELVERHEDAVRVIAVIGDGAGGVGALPAGELLAQCGEREDIEQVIIREIIHQVRGRAGVDPTRHAITIDGDGLDEGVTRVAG